MRSALRPSIGSVIVILGVVYWCAAPVAYAGKLASDPVEELRQTLKQDKAPPIKPGEAVSALEFRKGTLEKRIAALNTVGELSRALLLQDWRDFVLDKDIAAVDTEMRGKVAERFDKEVRSLLERGDATTRAATASFLGEMAIQVRNNETKSMLVRTRMAQLAGPLAKLVESAPEPVVQEAAARALGKLNPDPQVAVRALEPMLKSTSPGLRRAAAEAMSDLIKELSQSKKKPNSEPAVRADVLKAIQSVVPVAGRGLADQDPEVRSSFVESIQQAARSVEDLIPDIKDANFPPIGRTLTDEERKRIESYSHEVKAEVAELEPIFKVLGDQAPALARLLKDPDANLRTQAARTLEKFGFNIQKLNRYQATVPSLPGDGGKVEIARPAGDVQAVSGSFAAPQARNDALTESLRQTVPALTEALQDKNISVRRAAVDALEMLDELAAPAAPALTTALKDRDRFVRWSAARVLGKMGPVEGADPVPGLISLLQDSDLDLQLAAAIALERYGESARRAVPALAQSVTKGDAEFRLAVMKTLEAIGTDGSPAVSGLVISLQDADPRIRKAAAETLGRFGTLSRAAVVPLSKLLDDADTDVRRAASEALLAILPPAKK